MKKQLLGLLLLAFFLPIQSQHGLGAIDIPATSILTDDQINCLLNNIGDDDEVIAQVYTKDGEFNENGIQNLIHANDDDGQWPAAYVTPCRNANNTCKNGLMSGADQAMTVINRLNQENMVVFMFLEIKKGNNWPADQLGNRDFILNFTNTVKDAFTKGIFTGGVGIYTSYNDWAQVVGGNWTGASDMDLWWVKWNGKQDLYTDFTPFGGWTAPCFHQYAGNVINNNCANGVPVNYDYYDECDCQDEVCFKEFKKRQAQKKVDKLQHKYDRRH
uniref:Lysozyme n=1 Tax=Acrobeloides nanus TaxID=290746 RepID=A0A914CP55_9BILA